MAILMGEFPPNELQLNEALDKRSAIEMAGAGACLGARILTDDGGHGSTGP